MASTSAARTSRGRRVLLALAAATGARATVRRSLGAVGVTLALTLTAVGCGEDSPPDGSSSSATSTTEHNDADVVFASEMIQHHAQALSMVDLTLERPLDPEVQALAESIRAAQAPEIETMADWLTGWGEEVPETMRDHINAGHGDADATESMEGMDTDMPGMMSAEEMTALEQAPDAEFQQLWLEMMVEHHTGAVEMAEAEQEDGQYADAVSLAGDIAEAQRVEIEQMQALLGA